VAAPQNIVGVLFANSAGVSYGRAALGGALRPIQPGIAGVVMPSSFSLVSRRDNYSTQNESESCRQSTRGDSATPTMPSCARPLTNVAAKRPPR
jgi:hypothetical protein